MLFALLLQELFLLETVKFARPTILILFTFHRGDIKWMGKKENDLYLFYTVSSKIFSKISSTFKAELLWICSHMLHVLAFPLKQIQVITQFSVVYMVICICPRLLSRLVDVWYSTTSKLPFTSHYLRARNAWHASNSHSAHMTEKYTLCSEVELRLGWAKAGFTLQWWRPAALSWYIGRRDILTGIDHIPLHQEQNPRRKTQLSISPPDSLFWHQ